VLNFSQSSHKKSSVGLFEENGNKKFLLIQESPKKTILQFYSQMIIDLLYKGFYKAPFSDEI